MSALLSVLNFSGISPLLSVQGVPEKFMYKPKEKKKPTTKNFTDSLKAPEGETIYYNNNRNVLCLIFNYFTCTFRVT